MVTLRMFWRLKIPLTILCLCLLALLAVRSYLVTRSVAPHLDGPAMTNPEGAAGLRHASSLGVDLTSVVNTLIGTGFQPTLSSAYSGGETFPGADVPFGMLQWSPDTVRYAYSGYAYGDQRVRGFSLTHLSGAGCGAYGHVSFLPYIGSLIGDPARYNTTFSHANEMGDAGYYRVKLDSGVTTELAVTQHSGVARVTYPGGAPAGLLVNFDGSIKAVTDAHATLGSDTIAGWVSSGDFCGTHWNTYRQYFWAQFSQPFVLRGISHDGNLMNNQTEATGPASGAFVTFDTRKQSAINVRVGISYVSVANAEANVDQEDPSGSFDAVQQQAQQTWNQWLSEIQVSGGTADQRSTFYTALYHALLYPSLFSDVNGQYPGFDGHIHTVPAGHAQYANFSGWDIYRSEAPLLALLAPAQASDMAQSLLNDYQQSGGLPKWPQANSESYVMVGDPATAIIAEMYAFGGTHFDTRAALAAMIHQATQPTTERPGLHYLQTPGYLPLDGSYGCCGFYGTAATTLEYDAADFALSAFASALGDRADARIFQRRAQDWRNLFNPATGYLEPRFLSGAFPANYPLDSEHGWVEGNSAQFTWEVPFNLQGLFAVLGGNARVVPRLDTFFTHLNVGPDQPYAFLGNEPSYGTPWEYDYAGAPSKTQQLLRRIVETLYAAGPNGLPGNDDLGQMSSWYLFAALGMYPETPGTATLVLASPLFPRVVVHRPSGQVISISAPNASASTPYIQRLLVNGQPSTHTFLPPSFIAQGGTLVYTLASSPDPSWGTGASDVPPSYG